MHSFNRTRTFLVIALMMTLGAGASAQDRKYSRKSITGIGRVVFKGESRTEIIPAVTNRLKYYLETPRFDYNQLSESAVKDFVSVVRSTDLSPQSVATSLDQTVVKNISTIVSNYAEQRAKSNLKEEDIARAIVDKMKTSGLTLEDIQKVQNSAYLYLPVITAYEETRKDDNVTATITGYVTWYRIADGKALYLPEVSKEFQGTDTESAKESYQLKKRKVDGTEFARLMAANAWAKNISVGMKAYPDFRLSGEVKNVEGASVEASLGTREGIDLDEGYDVVDQVETNGIVETKTVGFVRVSEVNDNVSNPYAVSRFQHYLGGIEKGMVVSERPRLDFEVFVRPKFAQIKIERNALAFRTNEFGTQSQYAFFKDDLSFGAGAELGINYNLVKLVGVRQLFGVIELSGGVMFGETANSNITATPLFYGVYAGVLKKFWAGPISFNAALLGGADGLQIQNTNSNANSSDPKEISVLSIGVKPQLGAEFMLNPDLTFSINAAYRIDLSANGSDFKRANSDETFRQTGNIGISFGGVNISAGVQIVLPSSPSDPFASFGASKIDY